MLWELRTKIARRGSEFRAWEITKTVYVMRAMMAHWTRWGIFDLVNNFEIHPSECKASLLF